MMRKPVLSARRYTVPVAVAVATANAVAAHAAPADSPEIGEVLRATPPVRCEAPGKAAAPARHARTGDPLHAGDKLTIGPGGSTIICFYQSGLRYRLSVAADAKSPATLPIATNGREESLPHAATLRIESLPAVVASVAARLSPDARSKFGPLKASFGSRGYSRTKEGFWTLPTLDDAIADVNKATVLTYLQPLPPLPDDGRRYALTLYKDDETTSETRVWRSYKFSPDEPQATIPPQTLMPNARYRWELNLLTEDGRRVSALSTGKLWTLTDAQRTEMTTVVADAEKTPPVEQKDPDPLLLEAGVFHAYGLESRAADLYNQALTLRPTDAALRGQLVPMVQRSISVKPVEK